ncbi:hypothetical protein ACWKSP_08485 [Micromonosporaceae bacterium Da 78-11]
MTPGYRVHQGRTRTAAYVLLVLGLPVALVVALLRHVQDTWPMILVLLLCVALLGKASWPRVQRAVRRELLFAIDADGVFLGRNSDHSAREPWSRIDQVVHFTVSVSMTEGSQKVRYVGIAQRGRIVEYRAAVDWHFDIDRAAAATEKFGQGATLVEAPSLDQWTGPNPVIIALPPDWQTRHSRTRT